MLKLSKVGKAAVLQIMLIVAIAGKSKVPSCLLSAFHDFLKTFHMAALPVRPDLAECAVVSALLPKLSGFRGNDAGTRGQC